MAKKFRTWFTAGKRFGSIAGASLFVSTAAAQYNPDWVHQIRLGPMFGLNIKADFRMSGQFGFSSSQPGPAGVPGVDHIYDDGYVRVDATGNAQGYTSFWGYDSASQYDAATHRLFMHSSTSFETTTSASIDDSPYIGFELAYGAEPWRWQHTRIGFEVAFGLVPINIWNNQSVPAALTESIYSFDTGGILMPTAPYQGGSSGIGPTIHDIATAGSSGVVPGTITEATKLAADLCLFRLGPSFYWDLSKQIGLSASAGPALGLLTGELRYNETAVFSSTSSAQNQGKINDSALAFGAYVGAAVMWHAIEHGDIYFAAQFMPMGSTTLGSGGREVELKLNSQVYISAGFNWPF